MSNLANHTYRAPATKTHSNAEKLVFGTDWKVNFGAVVKESKTHKMMKKGDMHRIIRIADVVEVACGSLAVCMLKWAELHKKATSVNKTIDQLLKQIKRKDRRAKQSKQAKAKNHENKCK